ncbi:aromatic acid decarboxylase [Mangrovactinospora gilvigrisea]|uniref:Aromatic acid decarboxylase n=1 Tax=Mangrovactinospora gilvigrisea TaxID=1428644 RepID=A0A1J7CBX8_9ACTN|nr:aromatic acid decarboxylase [Mangrovactinospora gilvigrisea]
MVGVSGASGTPYAASVLRALLRAGRPVDLVISRAARLTLLDETGIRLRDAHWRQDVADWLAVNPGTGKPDPALADGVPADDPELLHYWPAGDLAAGPSSGSYPARGMIVAPASAASVAGMALGLSKDLLQRAASVTLKERRPLVVVVRETPLSGPVLRQLAELDAAGAVIVPAAPGFYAGPATVLDLVDFVAGRALEAAGVADAPALYRRWTGELGAARRNTSA